MLEGTIYMASECPYNVHRLIQWQIQKNLYSKILDLKKSENVPKSSLVKGSFQK